MIYSFEGCQRSSAVIGGSQQWSVNEDNKAEAQQSLQCHVTFAKQQHGCRHIPTDLENKNVLFALKLTRLPFIYLALENNQCKLFTLLGKDHQLECLRYAIDRYLNVLCQGSSHALFGLSFQFTSLLLLCHLLRLNYHSRNCSVHIDMHYYYVQNMSR